MNKYIYTIMIKIRRHNILLFTVFIAFVISLVPIILHFKYLQFDPTLYTNEWIKTIISSCIIGCFLIYLREYISSSKIKDIVVKLIDNGIVTLNLLIETLDKKDKSAFLYWSYFKSMIPEYRTSLIKLKALDINKEIDFLIFDDNILTSIDELTQLFSKGHIITKDEIDNLCIHFNKLLKELFIHKESLLWIE